MANLPARHRPNTHPAPSNCSQPSPNTSSRYHVHFSASDATSDRAIKVDTKRMKITPPRAISTAVLVSFEGRQSTPPSPVQKWRKYEELMRGGSFQPYFFHADVMCFAECCYRAVWFFRDHKRWSDRCSITNIARWYSPIDIIDARDWLSLHYQT